MSAFLLLRGIRKRTQQVVSELVKISSHNYCMKYILNNLLHKNSNKIGVEGVALFNFIWLGL